MEPDDDKPSLAFDDEPVGGPGDAVGGPDVAFSEVGEGVRAAPATSGLPQPRKLNAELAKEVELGKLDTCEVLNVRMEDARSGKLDDRAVRAQIDEYFRVAGKLGGAQRKHITDSFPAYVALAKRLTEIQKASSPAEALQRAAQADAHQRAMRQLITQADYALGDWTLEWREHEQMLAVARQLGLGEADVESAYAAAAAEHQRRHGPRDAPFVRQSKPPPPRQGWKPHRKLKEGGAELWVLADLQDAMLRHFSAAVEACAADDGKVESLVGYLEGQLTTPEQADALAAAKRALAAVTDRQQAYDTALGPWLFLWLTGVPELHVSSGRLPRLSARVRTLPELFAYVASHPAALDELGAMLSAGLLSNWLRIIARDEAAASVAEAVRGEAKSGLQSKAPEVLWRGVLATLWTAGMPFFPVVSSGGTSVRAVKDARELVTLIDEAGAAPPVVDRAITTGVMKTWLSRVDPFRVETLERAKGPLPGLVWAWINGARSLAVSPGGPIVRSLRELLDITDQGDATLTDDVLNSSALETWCEVVLLDAKLAAAARTLRLSHSEQRAELWRQEAGARELRIGGADASTPAAFAELSLAVHRGRDVSWEDIAGAIGAGLPQRRFRQMAPELVGQLDGLAAAPIPSEHKVLLACMAAKQRTLPLSAPGLSVEVGSLVEALAAIHLPGFRDKAAELVPTLVLSTWLQWFASDARSVAHAAEWAQRCRNDRDPRARRVAVDAMLRRAAREPRCFVSPRFSPSTLEELRAGILERDTFVTLRDPEVRDRIRDALGWQGGVRITGAPDRTDGPLEAQLAHLPPDAAAHVFAWTWLSTPVLWLSGSVVVNSREALLELLALPGGEGWECVRAASIDPLFPLWLGEGLRVGVPQAVGESGVFDHGAFARLAMWLGDKPTTPTLSVDDGPLSAGMGEGGLCIAECTVTNADSFRTLDIVVACHASDGVDVEFDGASSRTLCFGPGQQASLSVRVESKRGTGAGARWVEVTASPSTSPTQAPEGVELAHLASVASKRVSFRVGFPGGKVVAWGVGGMLGGLLLGAGYAAATGELLAGNRVLAAVQGSSPREDLPGAAFLGVMVVTLLLVVYRVVLGVRLGRVLPRADQVEGAMSAGGIGMLCLAPLGGCVGCSQSSVAGCVGGFGGGLGAGLLVGVLAYLRPGATRPRGESVGLPDVFYWVLAVGGLFLAAPLGLLLSALRDTFDVYSVMTAHAFGLSAPSLEDSAARGAALAGGGLGLAMGLRRGLVSVLRPNMAVGAFLATMAAFALFVHARRTSAETIPVASKAECASAVTHVIDTLSAAEGTAEAYRASPTYAQERDRAIELCVGRRVTVAQTQCLGTARAASDLGNCDAFWVTP